MKTNKKIKITESQYKRLFKEEFISWDSPDNIDYLLDMLIPNEKKKRF